MGESAQPGQLELAISEPGQVSGMKRGGEGEDTEREPVFAEVVFGIGRVEGPSARWTAARIHVRVSISVRGRCGLLSGRRRLSRPAPIRSRCRLPVHIRTGGAAHPRTRRQLHATQSRLVRQLRCAGAAVLQRPTGAVPGVGVRARLPAGEGLADSLEAGVEAGGAWCGAAEIPLFEEPAGEAGAALQGIFLAVDHALGQACDLEFQTLFGELRRGFDAGEDLELQTESGSGARRWLS
jgi:hypothetical protein